MENVQNYLYKHKDNIKGYINFHSYSQLILYPWSYTCDKKVNSTDYVALEKVSAEFSTAVGDTHGKIYEYGQSCNTMYAASGVSEDYAYGVCGITYSWVVELRDTGEFGFLLPPEEIIPTGEEIFAGVATMAKYVDINML